MDGLLIVDKPAGPTSHDVVARVRRALGERRIGHTGTLDPAATGVLALVLGRATRLAQFLSSSDKSYEAVVRLGFSTDTADAEGRPAPASADVTLPGRETIEAALDGFRGTFLQQPPAFSAKKIDGQRSHELARARARARLKSSGDDDRLESTGAAALPALASVTVHQLEIVSVERDLVTLRLDCSAGFYVRSLAHDLGERLGVGGHLTALRRVRSGDFSLADAVELHVIEHDPTLAAARLVALADMLPGVAPVVLTSSGVEKALHGREIGREDCVVGSRLMSVAAAVPQSNLYRLLDEAGALVAIARPSTAPTLLHPSVVLM